MIYEQLAFTFNFTEASAFSAIGIGAIISIIFQLIIALEVNVDAKRLQKGGGLFLFGPAMWGWIVFVFGIAGLAFYWACHHSSLRSNTPPHLRN